MWKFFEYEDKPYKINEYGEIISLKTNTLLKWRESKDGYWEVTLGRSPRKEEGNHRTSFKVHRLVAIHFVENPDPKVFTEVNHIDYNRKNPYYKNLEWVTHKQNIRHSWEAGHYENRVEAFGGANNPKAKLKEEQVIEIREKASKGIDPKILASEYKVSITNVKAIIKREIWKNI